MRTSVQLLFTGSKLVLSLTPISALAPTHSFDYLMLV